MGTRAANSAYEKAEKTQIRPANIYESTTPAVEEREEADSASRGKPSRVATGRSNRKAESTRASPEMSCHACEHEYARPHHPTQPCVETSGNGKEEHVRAQDERLCFLCFLCSLPVRCP